MFLDTSFYFSLRAANSFVFFLLKSWRGMACPDKYHAAIAMANSGGRDASPSIVPARRQGNKCVLPVLYEELTNWVGWSFPRRFGGRLGSGRATVADDIGSEGAGGGGDNGIGGEAGVVKGMVENV